MGMGMGIGADVSADSGTGVVAVGKTCRLLVVKEVDFGLYLDGGEEFGEILLPGRYVLDEMRVGDWATVFIYRDSEDIVIATTEKPFVEVGQYARLTVVDTNAIGAFMDWGLSKDLFVPFKEQGEIMRVGKAYTVWVYEDKTGRVCGSSKLGKHLSARAEGRFVANQKVKLYIAGQSPMGYKVIIEGSHLGLLYKGDVLVPVTVGQRLEGYIKTIRPDDAIDVMLQPQGEEMRDDLAERILADLKEAGGVLYLTDKSPPQEIFAHYQVSKSNYKRVLGLLYKEKKIVLEKDKISLPVADL